MVIHFIKIVENDKSQIFLFKFLIINMAIYDIETQHAPGNPHSCSGKYSYTSSWRPEFNSVVENLISQEKNSIDVWIIHPIQPFYISLHTCFFILIFQVLVPLSGNVCVIQDIMDKPVNSVSIK